MLPSAARRVIRRREAHERKDHGVIARFRRVVRRAAKRGIVREEILTHGINQQAVRQEVERRPSLGGELHHIECPEAYARNVLEGYDL